MTHTARLILDILFLPTMIAPALSPLVWKIVKKEYVGDELAPHVVVQNTQARKKYLEDELFKLDGQSSKRIVDFVNNFYHYYRYCF